jgi:hypothetical protein
MLHGARCVTVDPPSAPLPAPAIVDHDIIALPEQRADGSVYNEIIELHVSLDDQYRDQAAQLVLLYRTDAESAAVAGEPIPDSARTLYLSVKKLGLIPREKNRMIDFSIFAVDTRDRPGDTSSAYRVALAKQATLLAPLDTLDRAGRLRWELYDFGSPVRSKALLWSRDSALWESDFLPREGFAYIGNYQGSEFSLAIPDCVAARLDTGACAWGVRVEISGPPFPVSLISRGVYATP